MLHVLSFATFAAVLALSIAALVTTIRAELPLILKALGAFPEPVPPLRPAGERRVRVIRQARLVPATSLALRAA
jgi:hypothetical protein